MKQFNYKSAKSGTQFLCGHLDVNYLVKKKLDPRVQCDCESLAYNSECTAAVIAVCEHVQQRLLGDVKLGVTCVEYNFLGDKVCIKISCPRSKSGIVMAAHKAYTAIGQAPKLYSRYSALISLMNAKPDKDEFAWCARRIVEAFGKLECTYMGPAVKGLDDAWRTKAPKIKACMPVPPDGTKPSSLAKPPGDTEFQRYMGTGLGAALVVWYYRSFQPKTPVELASDHVSIRLKCKVKDVSDALVAKLKTATHAKGVESEERMALLLASLANAGLLDPHFLVKTSFGKAKEEALKVLGALK